jgi:orotate phosphoribosyltransferase
MPSAAQQISAYLLDIKAVKIQPDPPFTWASGWKSPIYCDNRLTLSYPHIRGFIKDAFVHRIRTTFPDVEIIAGVATAGIPQASLIAEELDLPLVYARSKPKGHGLENQIEGLIKKDDKVIVIEDLISTGGSSASAAEVLINSGADVLGVASIFTYGFEIAKANFESMNLNHFSLTDYDTLLQVALEKEYILEKDLEILKLWQKSPQTWMGA